MEYNKLSKGELIDILTKLKKVLDGSLIEENISLEDKSTNSKSELETLIGTIPFLLQEKEIFERNQDIADFASNLGIKIPSPEKKKKEDIIGRIILAITTFDSKKITQLNLAIKALKKSDIKRGKSNFFKDWENAINQMKI